MSFDKTVCTETEHVLVNINNNNIKSLFWYIYEQYNKSKKGQKNAYIKNKCSFL